MKRAGEEPTAWHALPPEVSLERVKSRPDGLTGAEAEERLRKHGPNTIQRASGPGPLRLFVRQIHNPIAYLLLGSAAVALALGKVTDGLVVFGAIIINAIIGFMQEFRAGKAIEALSRMVPQSASVLRDGHTVPVPASELVP
ncbi:MAG: cation-transporting P-type ATPase, partial [Polyangiaceae bacterium]|nr:cation-transporting P-type ATPase [Polyangiaceae bacterium]